MRNQADVLLQGLNREGGAPGFAVGFAEIQIRAGLVGVETYGVLQGGFGSRKITQRYGRDPKKHQEAILVRTQLEFAFKFLARPGIRLFAVELQVCVTEKPVRARVLGIQVYGFAKFVDRGFGKMSDAVGAPEQDVNR